ncbi:MAG: C40 family peptidase [Microbacteriaceae bacterium]|nr:C40 family peptidase [Microbacteriaceae bacterium]MCL2796349.1 C40 family peptidase [Microbacteriaceae bacterium]
MTDHDGSSFRRPPAITVTAASIGVVTASIAAIVHPVSAEAATPKYPSWSDVQQAKASVQAQQKMVDQINGLVGELQTNATTAGIQSEIAIESFHQAQTALDDATQAAADLQRQADAAQKTAQTSSIRAGLLASHLMRSAGTDGSLGLLLQGGDSGAADKLLYQLGTMSQLTEQSQRIYDQAVTDRNAAQAFAAQAKAAQQVRKQAADAAKQASEAAQAAATAAQAAVTTQQQKQSELTAQLASLKNESLQVAQQYVVGQQAIAAEKAAAAAAAAAAKHAAEVAAAKKAAADQAARDRAAAAAQHQQQPSGGGSSGGGGASGSALSAPSQPAPSANNGSTAPDPAIVNAVISYARAQIGKPYIWDGAGPTGFDCSGLTMMAYAYAGLNIGGHGVVSQYLQGQALGQLVPRSQALPGDLVMWGTAPYGLYHVGIYVGGGMMIAAPTVGDVVKEQPVWGTPIDVVVRPSMGR